MTLTPDQIKSLVKFVAATKADELTCDDCLSGMAEFAETDVAGKEYSEAMQAVEEHIDFCPECNEEYGLLKIALQAMEFEENQDAGSPE